MASIEQRIRVLESQLADLKLKQSAGNFTTGGILFSNTIGKAAQDTSNLYFDDTNNRLGIGTTVPSGVAHINFTGGSKTGLQIQDNTASSDTLLKLIDPSASISSSSYWIRALDGNTDSFYVKGDGSIYSGSNGITSDGANAGFIFVDRSGSENWQWYGTSSVARLYNGTRDTISIGSTGAVNAVVTDAVTNTTSTVQTFWHRSTGTVAANFGTNLVFNLHSDNGTDRNAADTRISWATATDASRKARQQFVIYDTAAREYFRGEASGSAAMIGFFGSAAAVKQAITGVSSGTPTAAQQAAVIRSIIAAGVAYGFWTDSTT